MNILARLSLATTIWGMISLVLISSWGWDQISAFAEQVPRAVLLPVWLVLSLYGAWHGTRTGTSGGKKEIRRHRYLFSISIPFIVAWFVYLPYADRHRLGIHSYPALRWTGLVLFVASLLLGIQAIRAQGKQFSMAVAIQEGHQLTTHGPYRLLRHPAYAGLVGIVLGLSLVFANAIVGFVAALLTWFWMKTRLGDEEKLLLEEFGQDYASYCQKTWRMVPFVY